MLGEQLRGLLDLGCRRLPHQVRVYLARHGRAGVSKDHLHDLDRHTPGQHQRAGAVSGVDVSAAALLALEEAADRFAIAYQRTPPALLISDIRRHVRYVEQLIGKRATLTQQRRLLVVGAWLSLLAATVDIDLRQRPAANARLSTAASLAEEAGHLEIVAWCLETQAWDALTDGRFIVAAELSQAAQRVAPRDGSAIIQSTAQEGRAWARLGDRRQARNALERVERMVSPLLPPDQPEHHFQMTLPSNWPRLCRRGGTHQRRHVKVRQGRVGDHWRPDTVGSVNGPHADAERQQPCSAQGCGGSN